MGSRASNATDPMRTFLRRLPLTLVAAMLIWMVLRPALDWGVSSLGSLLVRSFEYPRVTRVVVVDDHRAQVRRADFRADSKIPTLSLTEIHFNTIVLLALYLALPRPFSRVQLERLFMGWCILFLTQTFNLIFHVKFIYAFSLGEWSTTYFSSVARNIYGFLRYFTDLPGRFGFPFVVWLGFNWVLLTANLGLQSAIPEVEKKKHEKRKG
ncbi:MAG: hypothetical protein GY906_38290 [bacterium]|nr:hypothetical protein [bacterium]